MTGLTHGAMNAWVIPWNAAMFGLPEGARGIQTPVLLTVVVVILATVVVLARQRHAWHAQRGLRWVG
jgi:hypothetical protein